jgi:hypothetical protein
VDGRTVGQEGRNKNAQINKDRWIEKRQIRTDGQRDGRTEGRTDRYREEWAGIQNNGQTDSEQTIDSSTTALTLPDAPHLLQQTLSHIVRKSLKKL